MLIIHMIPPQNIIKLKMRKAIPKALRQQVWLKQYGKMYFENKCYIKWCNNIITPFNFEVGHNIPYSKGGSDDIDNLKAICSLCNKSMSNKYTIDEFNELGLNKNINDIEKINKVRKLKSSFNLPCCYQPLVKNDIEPI